MAVKVDVLIDFLETQWPNSNNNKLKGIESEIRLKEFLNNAGVHHIPGGWLMIPGKKDKHPIPTHSKICLLPKSTNNLVLADVAAYMFFRQVGVEAYFSILQCDSISSMSLPIKSRGRIKASHPKSIEVKLYKCNMFGELQEVSKEEAFKNFPKRSGYKGLRVYETGSIDRAVKPWTEYELVKNLFSFEYSRYYFQVDYLTSNNDLDIFIVGGSGKVYPVELKRKSKASDKSIGDWFGIDMGPFAKLAFFTANLMNNDAIYIVEEVDADGVFLDWWGIKFTELVKSCHWVGQAGGRGMTGGASSTFKIPKAAFSNLNELLSLI